jgi:hypothetical protein
MPAATFHSKFQESTDRPSWSTDKVDPVVSAAFLMPLIAKQAAADGDEAAIMEDAMGAEVDEVEDADEAMIPADGDGVIISMVSTLLTRTEASRGTNGIHWDPKVTPPCYL